MWKDSLCIGVDNIDVQHKELFMKTDELLTEINHRGVEHKDKCISTIQFLKNYAVNHFVDEEAYQESIGYVCLPAHKKLHVDFVEAVLNQEKKMVESNFDEKVVRGFTGMLVAWLLYHVADVDQKFSNGVVLAVQTTESSLSDIVCESVTNVLGKMTGLDNQLMNQVETHDETFDESLEIETLLAGDVSGYITLIYPIDFIKNMVYEMMNYVPDTIGELEVSALFELSNIISRNICTRISKERGISCEMELPYSITRPEIDPDEGFVIDTGIGIIKADINIDNH